LLKINRPHPPTPSPRPERGDINNHQNSLLQKWRREGDEA